MPLRLLGRKVLGGAENRACLGHVRCAGASDPEVRDLRLIGFVDHDVLRLQITMDHAVPMRESRRLEDLDHDVNGPDGIERCLVADQLLQRPAGDVLHRDVVRAVVSTAVVDADDVRVLQAGGGLGFAPKTLHEAGVLGEAPVQQLECDLAAQLLVLGEVHVGHPTRAEARDDLVAMVNKRADYGIRHLTGPRKAGSESQPWRSARRSSRRTPPATDRR